MPNGGVSVNAIMVLYPYKHEGMWVFDDERTDLVREPFMAGADTIIDRAIERRRVRNAGTGFRLIFSLSPFPLYDFKFRWVREADGGNWYYSEDFQMEGWLCPALFKYFDKAPEEIYAKFEEKESG